mgnify:CR=1 FL=1
MSATRPTPVELSGDVIAAVDLLDKKNIRFALDESIPTSHRPVSLVNIAVGSDTVQNVSLGATSSVSINPTWQVTVPDTFVLDSNIQLRLPFSFQFRGTTNAANSKCLPDNQWCMSRYAIYQAIQSITVTMDGASISKSIGEIMPLIADYTDLEDARSHDLYSCPDTVSNFAQIYGAAGADAARKDLVLGTAASPFAPPGFANSKYGSRAPVVVSTTDAAAAAGVRTETYDIDVFMALPWSIFASSGTGLGLGNLRQMRVSIQFNSEWDRLFNYLPALTGYAAADRPAVFGAPTFRGAPDMYCRYIKPADYVTKALINPETNLPHSQIHTMKQHAHWSMEKRVGVTGPENASSTPITLQSVPKRIFVAAVRARSSHRTGTGGTAMTPQEILETPSTYGLLSNVKISIGGRDANNSLTTFGLYEMSSRNGYSLPWSIAKKTGFAVCFDLQNDLSLGQHNILSCVSNLPLYVSADITNTAVNEAGIPVAATYDFVVVVETDSYLDFKPSGVITVTDAIELDAADKAALMLVGSHVIRTSSNTIGGSIFGTLFRGAKKVLSGLPKLAWDNRGKIFDYVKSSLASGFRPNSVGGGDALVPAKKPSAASKRGAGVAQSTEDSRIL